MTATPIPRTLSLILYGDLDVSIIDELPPGRKTIETYAVNESMRKRINKFMLRQLSEGRQIYIVCPLLKKTRTLSLKRHGICRSPSKQCIKGFSVGLIHGRMKAKDKDDIMRRFANGQINVLVSTTVIEVGVNVPNASLMIIENAERFGLSQLHQLRGRVGRGEWKSYCILFCEGGSDITRQRMKIMTETSDGFKIAEKDLELRGPGEFFGTRQHGLPELKVANLYSDMDLVKKSGQAANDLIMRDPMLENSENAVIKKKIEDMFAQTGLFGQN
jgi:ATP-dependent DNA helicase RecG